MARGAFAGPFGYFWRSLDVDSDALAAFERDMGPEMKRITMVVQTEFGRRVNENTGLGTDHPRFDKMRASLGQGLQWLQAHAVPGHAPTYDGMHFVAMWDHLVLYGLVPLDYPGLRARRAACARWPFVDASTPPPL